MKEPHKKGVAHHLGPESCAGDREVAGEALTGEYAGQPSNSEITSSGVPTLCCEGEGHTKRSVQRELPFDAAESETLSTRGSSMHGKPGDPTGFLAGWRRGTVGKGHWPHVRHARSWGVGRSHSTREAGEQSRRSGGGARGGKGIDQGKRFTSGRGPDTAPETRVVRAVGRTASST